jgi:hypothetical protein
LSYPNIDFALRIFNLGAISINQENYAMSTNSPLRSRASLAMLPLAGLLTVLGLILRGPLGNPSINPSGFAQSAASANFGTSWIIILLGSVARLYSFMILFGLLGLTRAGKLVFWAMLLSIVSEALFISLTGILVFTVPVAAQLYLQGDAHMLNVLMAGFFSGPVASVLYPAGLIGTLGSILFSIAIWRSNLPMWAGVLYGLTTPLLAFAPAFSYGLELLGGLLLLVSSTWLATAAWRQTIRETSSRTGQSSMISST